MKKIAIYPGTFDPITYGHVDVIKKSLKLVDKIFVAISESNEKKCLFSVEERMAIVKEALYKDLKFFEDYELWLRFIKSGLKIFNINNNMY